MSSSKMENPKAKVGFVIHYPMQYFIFKEIYAHLRDEAEFLVDMGAFFPVRQPEGLLEEVVRVLEREGAAYRTVYYEDYFSREYMEYFLGKYEALVSVWEKGVVSHPGGRELKKIHVMYGCSKELNFVRPSHGIYDLALAYGERGKELLSTFTHTEIVGDAKFDPWFRDAIDAGELSALASTLDASKQTILYLPTHSDLSSIDFLTEELAALSKRYNIVVRPHYFTIREEPERMQKLERTGLHISFDDTSLLVALRLCDMVISDNSSALFDAILADKPVLAVDFLDEDYLDVEHSKRRLYRRGRMGPSTYSDSIEQRIKREGKVAVLTDPKDLDKKVIETLRDEEQFRTARKDIVRENYSFNDGRSGDRAAEAIRGALSGPSPKKPILWHAFEAYKKRLGADSYASKREADRKIERYEQEIVQLKQEKGELPAFTVIILDLGIDLRETIATVGWQKYPVEAYEIVVMTGMPKPGAASEYVPGRPVLRAGVRIRFDFRAAGEYGSNRLRGIIESSSAEWVVFTESGCIPKSDWLIQYALSARGVLSVAAMGGYEQHASVLGSNRFLRFSRHTLAKKLGTHTSLRRYRWVYMVINVFPELNPAGLLSNTAYRREILLQLLPELGKLETNSRHVVAAFLRWMATQYGSLAFLPLGVGRIRLPTYGGFKASCFETGFAHGLLWTDRRKSRYVSVPVERFSALITDPISALSGKYSPSSFLVALTAFQAAYFRLIGFFFARAHVKGLRRGYRPE